MIVSNR